MINNHLKHFISRYLTKDRSVPFHWLFHERWDSAFWKEYRRASLFDRSVNKKTLSRVWVLSYSCSGTHNFTSQFHYMPGAFVFGENMFSNKSTDPLQFDFQVNQLRPAHWLFGSVFLQQGLQEKRAKRLTHLFLLSNSFLKYQKNIDINAASERDHILIYLRNFIRVLFSQDKDSKKHNKPYFAMTDVNFTSAVANHRRRIDECLSLAERHEKKLTICFHEHL